MTTSVRKCEEVGARVDRHDHLFHRGVAGALADAVDGALDLARAVAHGGQRVGDGHAEVVVAVRAPADRSPPGVLAIRYCEQPAELVRHGVAGGVGHVDGARRRGAMTSANTWTR